MSLISSYPELQKNLWLRVSRVQLILWVVLVLMVLFIAGQKEDILVSTSIVMFYVVTVIWGSYTAGESIPNEIQDKTWDWVRLSGMTPMQLTIGKLFGETILPWILGGVCLVAFLMGSLVSGASFGNAILLALSFKLTATLFHAFAMMLGAFTRDLNIYVRRLLVVGLVISLTSFMLIFVIGYVIIAYFLKRDAGDIVSFVGAKWFIFKLTPVQIYLLTVAFLNVWAFGGLYRTLKEELFYTNKPYFLIYFLVGVPLYFSGFLFNIPELKFKVYLLILMVGIAILGVAVTFYSALLDRMELNTLRRFFRNLNVQNWEKVLEDVPTWLVSMSVQLFASIIIVALSPMLMSDKIEFFSDDWSHRMLTISILILTINLFSFRDVMIVVACNFTQGAKGLGTAILTFFIVYYLAPTMLVILTEEKQIVKYFYSLPIDFKNEQVLSYDLVHFVLTIFQAGLMFLWVKRIWDKKNRLVSSKSS